MTTSPATQADPGKGTSPLLYPPRLAESELTHRARREIGLYLDHYLEPPGIAWNANDRMAWLLEEVHGDVYVALADGDVVATRKHLAHLGAMAVRWLAATYDGLPT